MIPGSHKLGRLSHARAGDLATVEAARLAAATRLLGEPVTADTSPGDCLFFHRSHDNLVVFVFVIFYLQCIHLCGLAAISCTPAGPTHLLTGGGTWCWPTTRCIHEAGDRVSGSRLTSPHHYCCRWATLPTTTSSCLPPPPWTWWRTRRWSPGAGTSQPLTSASSGTSRTTQQRICDSYFESIEYLNYSLSGNNLHDHESLISNLINNFVF